MEKIQQALQSINRKNQQQKELEQTQLTLTDLVEEFNQNEEENKEVKRKQHAIINQTLTSIKQQK